MRRLARNHRGGHLWTPGIPDSIEADAYRNLRASQYLKRALGFPRFSAKGRSSEPASVPEGRRRSKGILAPEQPRSSTKAPFGLGWI